MVAVPSLRARAPYRFHPCPTRLLPARGSRFVILAARSENIAVLILMTHHTGRRLAELAFLLILLAGAWMAAAEIPGLKFASGRSIVAGLGFAVAGLLLIIAVHWGHFG
jgi:hypothetical protein